MCNYYCYFIPYKEVADITQLYWYLFLYTKLMQRPAKISTLEVKHASLALAVPRNIFPAATVTSDCTRVLGELSLV